MGVAVTAKEDINTETLPWGSISWMISGSLGNSGTMTFGRVVIKAGHSNPRHAHTNCDEILYLLSGVLEHTYGDEKVVMKAGDSISVPKNIVHNATALGGEDAVMIVAYSSAYREMIKEG